MCGSHNQTPFSEFIPLAKYFTAQSIQIFFILEENADMSIVYKLRASKIDYYLGDKKNFYSELKNSHITSKSNTIKQKLKKLFPVSIKEVGKQFLDLLTLYKYFSKTDTLIEKIFTIEKPNALVLYGDRVMGLVPSSIKWMKKNNKPVIDIQIAVSDENFLYSSFRKNSLYVGTKNPFNWLFGLFFPKYKRCFKNECVLFYSWSMILILWIKNLLPPNPWNLGQSWADKFLLISLKDQKIILENCPEATNCVVTGQFSHDLLFDVYKNKLQVKATVLKKYFEGEQTDKEIIILGMPQFYEHYIFDKKRSDDEIGYILDNLNKLTNKLVFISLHPKMSYEDYCYINEKYENIRVLKDERLSGVLPIGDYFISMFESTINWAMLCSIIPIFLDYYQFGFDMSKYNSVQVLKDRSSLKTDMEKIFENKKAIQKDLENEKELLPPFEGKNGEKILSEIRKVVNEK